VRGLPASMRAVLAFFALRRRLPVVAESGPDRTGFIALVRQVPPDLLGRALTHSSWVAARTGSYERLEFLGDSVLGLAIASALYERYPESEEGDLARLKAFVVSRASCGQVAEQLDLKTLILEMAPAPEQKRLEAAGNVTILGNVLEALIGAVLLAHGYERTRAAVVEAFDGQIRYGITSHVDHKTALQELLAPRGRQPAYRLLAEDGPPHARVFTSEVSVEGRAYGQGTGTTIKISEQAAAKAALAVLRAGEGEV